MDGRGRLAQSLTWIARLRARPPNIGVRAFVFEDLMRAGEPLARHMLRWTRRWFLRCFLALLRLHVPRGIGADPTPDESKLNCLNEALAPMRNTRAQAPAFVTPHNHLPADQSLARLSESRTRMIEGIERLADYDLSQLKYPHPLLGELDMYQWLLIAGGHEGRHVAQIGRIKAAAGFPSN